MRYENFEHIVSHKRMERYLIATGGNTRRAMALYKLNIQLTKEMFGIVCMFEIALRNKIHDIMVNNEHNEDWLIQLYTTGPLSTLEDASKHPIFKAYDELVAKNNYTACNLLAKLSFGNWVRFYLKFQFNGTRHLLFDVFPKRPYIGTLQKDREQIHRELHSLNFFRNRLAHHEPICFTRQNVLVDLSYAEEQYMRILRLFNWMDINSDDILKSLDKVNGIISTIKRKQYFR